MILNTGTRTDIPAFFSEWFFNRIKDGFVLVRNPLFPEKVIRYELNPYIVDCLAFCTKNPAPMIPRLDEIANFWQFWFVTITPYGKEIELFVPVKEKVIQSFKELSGKLWAPSVSWRYDPIFINETYTLEKHIESFEYIARELTGYTTECVISFIHLYEKTKRNFPWVRDVTPEERFKIGEAFSRISKAYNITLKTCVEWTDLAKFDIDCTGCMTSLVLERITNYKLTSLEKKSKRWECNCLIGNDIGMYNTCMHGCIYCYANYDQSIVMRNFKKHDPHSPFLIS